MPDYRCRDCGAIFDPESDKPVLEQVCPDCGSTRWGLVPQRSTVGISGLATDWSQENNGKGRRIAQLDYGVRKPYYAKSQRQAIDEAKSRGLEATPA